MERQRVRIAIAVMAAAGLTGCFEDPAGSLRNGPAALRLTRSAVIVPIGDSVQVEASVTDEQGNILPASDAVWTSDNAAIADVAIAETQLPANGSSRAYIKGINVTGGITTVRVTMRGISDSVRVTALPTALLPAGTFAVTGTAQADTTSLGQAYTAGDTLTVNAPTGLVFDAATSAVLLGGTPTYVLTRTATQIKVMAIQPHYQAPVTVTNITFLGNATTGDITVPTLNTADNASVSRARFRGTAVVAASAFGPGTQLTLTAQAGTAFRTAAPLTAVSFGTTPATLLTRTATTIVVISPAAYTGIVKLTNVDVTAGGRADSLFTPGNQTIAPAFYPGTVANGAGGMVDTIKIWGGGNATFTNTGAEAARSQVTINGLAAYVIRRTADSMYVMPRANGTGQVAISVPIVSGTTIPSLTSQASLTVGPATGEANEPGNDAFAGGTVVTAPVAVNDTVTRFGTMGSTDLDDYWRFTPATTGSYRVVMDWLPAGIDADIITVNAQFAGYACGGPIIMDGCGGATGADPEISTATLTGGTSYGVWVFMYDAHGNPLPVMYRIRFIRLS